MLKRLAILAITAFMAVSVSGQPNQAANTKQGESKHDQPGTSSANTNDKQNNSQADQPKPGSNPPKWYAAVKRPEWWLVIAAFSTLAVVIWQSIATTSATKAMRRSVSLQEANMRQWVNIEPIKTVTPPNFKSIPEVTFQFLFHGFGDGRLLRMKPSGLVPEVADYKREGECPNPN